jgi:hypothetical protein
MHLGARIEVADHRWLLACLYSGVFEPNTLRGRAVASLEHFLYCQWGFSWVDSAELTQMEPRSCFAKTSVVVIAATSSMVLCSCMAGDYGLKQMPSNERYCRDEESPCFRSARYAKIVDENRSVACLKVVLPF